MNDGPSRLSSLLKRVLKREPDPSLRETIEELIEDSQELEPSIESDERELLGNVLNLRDLTAADVMSPRADIVAVPHTIDGPELLSIFIKNNLSRIPVYRDNMDEVIGVIDIKDILAWCAHKNEFSVRQIIREILFVSPAMRTLDLLFQMRETGIKMAIVVDEYGGVDGLVTLSDLMEEIIGDIQNSQETTPIPKLQEKADGTIVADGRVTLEQIIDDLNIDLTLPDEEDEVDTLAGLVIVLAGRVPVRGELIKHPSGVELEVLDADPRRVKRICMHLKNFERMMND